MSSVKRSRGERVDFGAVRGRAVLVRAHAPDVGEAEVFRSLAELSELLAGLGIDVVGRVVQARAVQSATYLGEGKLREVAALTGGPGEVPRGPDFGTRRAEGDERSELVVVVDDELTAAQQRNLELALGCEVLDRTAVILRVFEARARTPLSRLEVELARLEYELPRIRDDHSLGDREGGGGRASRGHTNVELAKQRFRDRIAGIRRELEQMKRAEDQRRAVRCEVFRVALVGYTNAGKSSIMQRLTNAGVLVEDKLFATLGTTVRQLDPPARPPIVLADTVGFIDRLPHALVASFRSTLAEAREAQLLLQVADVSAPDFRRQIAVTEAALSEVGAGAVPALLLLNKADRLDAETRESLEREYPDALVMSALHRADCERLRARIDAFFEAQLSEATLTVPYEKLGLLAEFRDRLKVVDERYDESVSVTVRGLLPVIAALEQKLR